MLIELTLDAINLSKTSTFASWALIIWQKNIYDFEGNIEFTDIFFIPRIKHASERFSWISAPTEEYSSSENILNDDGWINTRKLCVSIKVLTWLGVRGTLKKRKEDKEKKKRETALRNKGKSEIVHIKHGAHRGIKLIRHINSLVLNIQDVHIDKLPSLPHPILLPHDS